MDYVGTICTVVQYSVQYKIACPPLLCVIGGVIYEPGRDIGGEEEKREGGGRRDI